MVGDATAFHTLVCNIGVEFLKGELGGLLSYVFFHKDGEFGGGIGDGDHGMKSRNEGTKTEYLHLLHLFSSRQYLILPVFHGLQHLFPCMSGMRSHTANVTKHHLRSLLKRFP